MGENNFKIRFLQHASWVNPGAYLLWADKHGYEYVFTKVFEYNEIPTSIDADMLVVLGGPQNPATTLNECDYFDADREKKLIELYANRGRIVLGSCLGAQLLGEALGATFHHSPYPEVGPIFGKLTPEGRSNPLFSDFPNSFIMGEWHNDMPGLTHNAEVLAYSDGCPHQIVRYGRLLYGFQTHMEFTNESIKEVVAANDLTIIKQGPYIKSEEEILNHDYSLMNHLLESFLDKLVEEYRK